ncbi:MAG: hypothetical protein ABIK89_12760, partial [Planctomycetota bacterium]
PVRVTLKNQPVGQYKSLLVWDVRSPDLTKIASGTIPHDQAGAVSFTPTADGVYLLGASAGSCSYAVAGANVPVALYAGERLHLIHAAKQLYFKVPEGVDQFKLPVEGSGGETVRVNVLDPEGTQVATGQTTLETTKITIDVPVGNQAGKIWSLEITRADTGVLEDNAIQLDAKLPPTLSLVPEQVFDLRRQQ